VMTPRSFMPSRGIHSSPGRSKPGSINTSVQACLATLLASFRRPFAAAGSSLFIACLWRSAMPTLGQCSRHILPRSSQRRGWPRSRTLEHQGLPTLARKCLEFESRLWGKAPRVRFRDPEEAKTEAPAARFLAGRGRLDPGNVQSRPPDHIQYEGPQCHKTNADAAKPRVLEHRPIVSLWCFGAWDRSYPQSIRSRRPDTPNRTANRNGVAQQLQLRPHARWKQY
jgi:hypothetical protein